MGKAVVKVLNGPIKGKVYALKNNMLFGRTAGDIVLRDDLVSDPHAKIEIYSSGKIMLIDQNSKNGIYVNGNPKVKAILEEGSKFSLGNSEFEVLFIKFPEEIWSDILKKSLSYIEDDTSIHLSAFSKEVHLHFLKGYQQGETRILAYGPRSFGSESPDNPIFDKNVPDKAFTLIPKDDGVLFQTDYPDIVHLNEKKVSEQMLQGGEIISIDTLEIKIQLKDSSLNEQNLF